MIQKIKCYFGKHDYRLFQTFDNDQRRLICPACKKTFAMSDRNEAVFEWDSDFSDMYESFDIKLKKLPWEKP